MKKNYIKSIRYSILNAFIYLIAIFQFSCTEVIDIELNTNNNQRLVVEGFISTDTTIKTIRLTKTADYFSNVSTPPVTNAIVNLSDGTNTVLLKETSPGYYTTDSTYYCIKENEYSLNITLDDNSSYEAISSITSVCSIDSLSYEDTVIQSGFRSFEEGFIINLFANETPGTGNYYLMKFFIDGVLDNDTLNEFEMRNDDAIDGYFIPPVYWIEDSKIKNDSAVVKVELHSISKKYFEFIFVFMMETDYRGGMFDGPPANIPSNISNGALGFFQATDVSSKEITVYKK